MAYSGLGTGTQADPYQITTVSQFKEMDSTTYSGKYFLQMNDLDFAAEASVSLLNYRCKLNGGGHSIDNIPLDADGFINLYSGCSITNCNFIFDRVSVANSVIFKASNVGATLSTLSFIVENKHGLAVQLFDANGYLFQSTIVEFIKAEGNFSRVFPAIGGNLTGITVYNSNGGHVPLVSQLVGNVTFLRCVYHKPFTKTVSSIPMGLFIDMPYDRIVINECAVIVNKFINELTDSYVTIGGFVGKGEMEIRNSYVVGSFEAPYGDYFHALYGMSTSDDCIFSGNYFYGNLVSNRKIDPNVVSALPSTGCYYCKELLTDQSYNDQYATGLTVEQFKDESNFLDWDFTNIWAIGVDTPYLRNSSALLSQFNPESLLQTGTISLGAIQRISGTQFSVQLTTDNTADFGIEVSENGVEVDTKFNEKGTVIFNTTKDYDAVIKAFNLAGQAREYVASQSYYHYHLDQIAVTDVTADKYTYLSNSDGRGTYIHGSILIGDYLYGTSRGSWSISTANSIVKVLASDVSQFEAFPISVLPTEGSWQMDSVCQIGNKLYTVANDDSLHNYMIVFDLLTNTHQSYYINEKQSWGAASCTDGTYLYVCLGPDLVSKIDPAVFNSTEKYNTSSPWPLQSLDFVNTSDTIAPHTMCVDSEHLYVGLGAGGTVTETSQALLKINKQTMQLVAAATGVPKMTDDMCQTDTHLFVGIEPDTSSSYGAKIGCCAVRKSDMRVTMIRKLHETDLPDVKSYASLIFGNYLIDLKTNSHIYALDISNPDSWNDDDRGAHTLKVYKTFKPGGNAITDPINEVYLTESGKFVGFAWSSISYAVSFDLPGLDYFAEPTVITDDAAIVGDTGVSLSGYITSTGGKAVSEVGVIIGQAADLSDGTPSPVTPVTTEFEKAFSNLEYGTYYFRTYAVNAEGTGYGKIKSFTLVEPYTEPTVITAEAVIIGDTGVSLSGYITSTGGKAVSEVGVIIGQAADLSDGTPSPVTPVTTEFEKAFSNLEYGTYYFRTYAVNAEGTGYGEIKSFTLVAEPTVITEDAAIIGDDGASISGYIQNTGGKTVTAIGVILGQAADLSDGVNYPVTPVVNEFEKVFSNLAFGTYYFRTYATNAEGMGYGEIKSFTLEPSYTEPGQPSGLDKAIQAEISISWTAPADDGGTPIIGYKIERKISGGEWEVIVANTENTNTTYTETLPQGVYQYRVSAITTYGAGSSSATLDVNAVVGGGGAGAGAYKIYLGSTEMVVL